MSFLINPVPGTDRTAKPCTKTGTSPRQKKESIIELELLESRLLLSADGLPDIAGNLTVGEGELYTINLDAGDTSVHMWEVDWGDGHIEGFAGSATTASHVYADGWNSFDVSVTAIHNVEFPIFQWSAEAGGNDHYYALTELPGSWLAANDIAESLGGYLVSITSQAEQNFITQTFLSGANQNSIYWIGLSDQLIEGTFVWISGESFDFTAWGGPEPNDFGPGEDYVALNWQFGNGVPAEGFLGSWNDAPLNGVRFPPGGPVADPYRGLVEFDVLPTGDVTVRNLTVEVANIAPAVEVTGLDNTVIPGNLVAVEVTASDPSQPDQDHGFTFQVDWESDGEIDETVTGSAANFSARYLAPGTYNVTITAIDKDGGVGQFSQQVVVLSANEQIDLMVDQIKSLVDADVISKKQGKGLVQDLAAASKQLDRDHELVALLELKSAIHQTNKGMWKGQIPAEVGQDLIESIDDVIQTIMLTRTGNLPRPFAGAFCLHAQNNPFGGAILRLVLGWC